MATVYEVKKRKGGGRPKRFWDLLEAIRFANAKMREGKPVIIKRIGRPTLTLERLFEVNDE